MLDVLLTCKYGVDPIINQRAALFSELSGFLLTFQHKTASAL